VELIWPATWNSFVFAGTMTFLEESISIMVGYVLSRSTYTGSRTKLENIMMFLPCMALLVGVLYALKMIEIFNSIWGIVLVKVIIHIPIMIWMMKRFFDDIPWSVEWAGMMDGCSRFAVWYTIVLPLIKPFIIGLSIFSFLSGWTQFLLVHTFSLSDESAIFVSHLPKVSNDPNLVSSTLLSAVSICYMIPVFLFLLLRQKMPMHARGRRV